MAREFDGADGVLYNTSAVSDDLALGSLTISAWIYPDTTGEGGAGRIVDKRNTAYNGSSTAGGGLILYTTGTNSWAWGVLNSSGTIIGSQIAASNSLTFGAWNHIAVTYDNAGDRKGHLYVNGTEVSYATDTAASGTVGTHTGDFLIGNHAAPSIPIRTFDGRMAELAVYKNAVLTSGEIAALAFGSAPIMVRPQSLLHYVPMFGRGGTNSAEEDWVSGDSWAKSWTNDVTVADHPRIIYPRRRSDIWVPPATGLPTLSASTYVTGSLTSTGWRPRVTAQF